MSALSSRTYDFALPSPNELRSTHPELFELSDWMGLFLIASDWLQIGSLIAVGVILDKWYVSIFVVWLVAFKQFVMSESTVHLAAHGTLFKTKSLNKNLEFFFSVPYFRPVSDYTVLHRLHHLHATTPQDPDFKDYEILGLSEENLNVIWKILIYPFLGKIAFLFMFSWIPYWFNISAISRRFQICAFYGLAGGLSAYFGHFYHFAIYWLFPLIFLQNQITAINQVAEHFRCRNLARQRIGFFNLLYHDEGYHLVHHLYPSIPWFKTRKANEILGPMLGDTETCRGFIFDTIKNIRSQTKIPYVQNYASSVKPYF